MLAFVGAAAVPAASQADYSNTWYCNNWPSRFCWDPTPNSQGGAWHNWKQSEIQNLSNVLVYQCMEWTSGSGYRQRQCQPSGTYAGKGDYMYVNWYTSNISEFWPVAGAGGQTSPSTSSWWNWWDG